jgi:hypothetical protein
MDKPITILGDPGTSGPKATAAPVMVYTIKDDLSVTPASNAMSGVTLLAQCGIKDVTALQEKTVKIGKEEVRGSLHLS